MSARARLDIARNIPVNQLIRGKCASSSIIWGLGLTCSLRLATCGGLFEENWPEMP